MGFCLLLVALGGFMGVRDLKGSFEGIYKGTPQDL